MPTASPIATLALAAWLAAPAAAELAPFDAERAAALAKQLDDATSELYSAVLKEPQPVIAAGTQRRDYYRLKHETWRLKNEAEQLARALARGEGQEETLPMFESLRSSARWAEQRARSVFTTKPVNERAAEVARLIRELAPYYDPEASAAP